MAGNRKIKTSVGAGQSEKWEAYWKVIYYFFAYPEQAIGLNSLAKKVGVSKTTARTAVLHLAKDGFLKVEEVGRAWRISPNSRHAYNKLLKIPYNLELIYRSGALDAVYEKVPGAKAVILFGSYRWGTDNEKSDIDIAAEISGGGALQIVPLGEIECGFRKNVKANLHIFSRKKINLNLFTNIANGIVLDGLLEVHPWCG